MIRLNKYSPIINISKNVTHGNNLDVIASYKVELDEIHTLSENVLDSRFNSFYSAIKTMPIGTLFYKQDFIIRQKYNTDNWNEKGFINKEYKKHFNNRDCYEHICLIHIVLNNKGSILKNENIKNPFKPIPKFDIDLNNSAVIQLLRDAERVMNFIAKSSHYKISKLTAEEIEEITNRYFNGMVDNQYSDTIQNSDNYKIGDRLINAYCIKSNKQFIENEYTNAVTDIKYTTTLGKFIKPIAQDLLYLKNADVIYNQLISIENHLEIRKSIRELKTNFEKAGKMNVDFDNTVENLSKLDNELSEDNKIQFVRCHFNVILLADSDNDMVQAQSEITDALTALNIKPYMPKGNMLANIFNNSFFSNVSNLDIDSTFTTDLQHALCLLNYEMPYRSDEKGILFTTRFNVPCKRDTWDEQKKRIKARNFMIVAPTGEGKSNLAQHKLISLYFEDEKNVIVICDLGNSFEKLAYLFPNECVFIRYKEGYSLGINPFSWYGEGEPTKDFFQDLIGFLEIPYKRGAKLTEEENVSLTKILQFYYSQIPTGHDINQFYTFIDRAREQLLEALEIPVDDLKYFDLKQFLHNCGEFVNGGKMSFLFDTNKSSEQYDIQNKRFVVFEFDEAKDNPTLLAMLLQLKDNIIQRLIWSDRTTKGIVFYDEVAKFFNFPLVYSSICYSAQTMRKYEASIGMALQSPTQLPLDPDNINNTLALIKNTQLFYCLPDPKGYDAHKEILKFSDNRIYLLNSIKSDFKNTPSFSELVLCIGDDEWILRLEIPKNVLLVYQTDGAEHVEVIRLYKQFGTMERAIEEYFKIKNN